MTSQFVRGSKPAIETSAAVPICVIAGELDALTVEGFRTQVLGALRAGETVVVDLRSVTFFSIRALRALLELQRLAEARHCDLQVLGSRCVDRVFEAAGAVGE
ncbi:STAS domain-containing protein [Nocardia yamanashiensis]|uniref:STAS domain-containing protein n=1 Tax=Nocardia yamanashiensis TaxID=209247 RepID=UPI001E3C0924|nr:STAS domain-containing protein [Nocardia yamanashiensis]UGT44168.1 STAS domain-containing protein [Nocardia yamanashiensis]